MSTKIYNYTNQTKLHVLTEFVKHCSYGNAWLTCSGVVEGNAGERRSPKYFLGNAIPPNDIRTRGNGDTVVFSQVGLQRNAKSMVGW